MLSRPLSKARHYVMLPVRLAVGAIFLVHGGQKLFVWGFAGVAQYMTRQGIEPAMFWAVVVTLVEFFGGIAVLIGLLTRPAALLLAVDMLVAILVVHIPNGFFIQNNGIELALALLGACLTLLLGGAGRASVESALGKELI